MNDINKNIQVSQRLLSELVAENFEYASVFEKYGMDFCCKGKRKLEDVCNEKGVDTEIVVNELEKLQSSCESDANNYGSWDLSFLIDYIINNHHSYVLNQIPVLKAHTEKIAEVHGVNHPELSEVKDMFRQLSEELLSHMEKEEKIIFPIIKEIENEYKRNGTLGELPFQSIKDQIEQMENEHTSAGDLLYKMRDITGNYYLPDDACTTYEITFKEIDAFEKDLHKHIHLENNILFPKAIKMEFDLNFH